MNLIAHLKHNSFAIRVFGRFPFISPLFQNNPSEINFDFVQFEIVFPQIVHVFGAKTARRAPVLGKLPTFVALMPCPRVFTQIRPIARLTVESHLFVFHLRRTVAICNEMRNEKMVKLVNISC